MLESRHSATVLYNIFLDQHVKFYSTVSKVRVDCYHARQYLNKQASWQLHKNGNQADIRGIDIDALSLLVTIQCFAFENTEVGWGMRYSFQTQSNVL